MNGHEKHDPDDPILKALRAAAREETRADESAHADLLRAAPHLAAPPDEAARQRITDALLGLPAQRQPPRPATRRRLMGRRLFLFVGIGAPLAAAAGALLVVRPRSAVAPLPPYDVEASGGLRDLRGPADVHVTEPQKLAPTSVLRLTLRPAVAVDGPVEVRAFAARGGEIAPLQVSVQTAPSGAVALRAPARESFGERRGRWELRVVVLRPSLAGRSMDFASGGVESGPGWQRFTLPIDLVAD